jgi:hypothetical protein
MFWARLGTQSWNTPVQNGKSGQEDERASTETAGSGIDPLNKPVDLQDPVTPELQVTKTFEEMAIRNAEIAKAQIPRSEPHSEGNSRSHSPEFVDAVETSPGEEGERVDLVDEESKEKEKENLEAQH